MIKKIIHVSHDAIKGNEKGESRPVIAVRVEDEDDTVLYADELIIYGQDGLEAARIKYAEVSPHACKARVWIETENIVEKVK